MKQSCRSRRARAPDRIRLEQALVNLVENALRHGAGTITLTGFVATRQVEIHIADEGPGFDKSMADTAFERFTRGDQARGSGGAGLGLAIVNAIVAAHGGSIAISTDTPRGADVVLTLPAVRSETDTTRSPTTASFGT